MAKQSQVAVFDVIESPTAVTPSLLDRRRGDEWTAGRHRRVIGIPCRILNDGPEPKPRIAANDNEAQISWPLAKALRADCEPWLLAIAAGWRRIDELANSGDLRGTALGDTAFQVDQRTWVRPDGVIIYKGPRTLTGGDPQPIPAMMTAGGAVRRVPEKWNGDAPLHMRIDASRMLTRVHAALGPLLQPAEDAVVSSWTLEAIGRREGYGDKTRACAVGKAIVYRGLAALGEIFSSAKHRRALKELGVVASV
jgi:hypothetical protein